MTPICTALMHSSEASIVVRRYCRLNLRIGSSGLARRAHAKGAFTLVESMVIIAIVSLFAILSATSFKTMIMRHSFRSRVQSFISSMEAAAVAASQTGKRYEMIIDITEQSYLLREITSPDLAQVLEEEIIVYEDFGNNCYVNYVLFDDGEFANQGRAKFRAAPSGWQWGGVIVLLDEDERVYSVVINRLSNIVAFEPGEVEMLYPRTKDELPF